MSRRVVVARRDGSSNRGERGGQLSSQLTHDIRKRHRRYNNKHSTVGVEPEDFYY